MELQLDGAAARALKACRRTVRQLVGLASCVTLALVVPTSSAVAATILVQPGPQTVQSAMATAAPGDSVVLQPGTYYLTNHAIELKPGVTLTSTMGAQATTIDTEFEFCGVYALSLTIPAIIDGIGFNRCAASVAITIGGAIYCSDSDVTIRNCLFTGNAATDFEGGGGNGGAIAIIGGAPTIERNTIVGNQSAGGAISLVSTRATVRDNVIAYNRLKSDYAFGHGIFCYDAGGSNISNNLFWANEPAGFDAECSSLASGNFEEDPAFCSPSYFSSYSEPGDWRTQSSSPLAPGGKLSGLGVYIGACEKVAAKSATWGWVKGIYR